MSKLIVGAIVYNEEKKFLSKFLENIKQYANEIVMIDDGSNDNSQNIIKQNTDHLFFTDHLFPVNELVLRNALWAKCTELCDKNDYIMIQDCDELMHPDSITHFREEFDKCRYYEADSMAWHFYDMWDDENFRYDKYWVAHCHWWVHTVKYNPDIDYIWKNTKLHCGRLPINSYYNAYPSKLQIQHMAYSNSTLRQEKYNSYMSLDGDGKDGILEQYKSIIDENPHLIKFKSNF